MALKTIVDNTDKKTFVLLELALPKRYFRDGVLYVTGDVYKFSKDQALVLLAERDNGRPIWKTYVTPQEVKMVKAPETRRVVDATSQKVHAVPEERSYRPGKRIDIGDDSEIADIVKEASQEGDTVTIGV